ncbi:MAG: hypothetical protein QGH58_08930 [Arenicellales bacterium]|nr:hypothetical protein [Arenicellales bacterium]MDP6792015.1 hypothetical protein [Arenicellales bacterium]MDP6917621.1 hypothetical protein [Arenicellales bacterium]
MAAADQSLAVRALKPVNWITFEIHDEGNNAELMEITVVNNE